jgi:methionyl aminopeptidase
VYVHDDDWSISTEDGSLACHFEHTVAITAGGPRILTAAGAPIQSPRDESQSEPSLLR